MSIEIIGAGFGRTGTNTLKEALVILGFPCYHMTEVFKGGRDHCKFWLSQYTLNDELGPRCEDIFKGYTATCDFPSSSFYKEQMARYPEAKVILTLRDPEKWYQSVISTIHAMSNRHDRRPIEHLMLPKEMLDMFDSIWAYHFRGVDLRSPRGKQLAIDAFNKHNEEVIAYVPKDKLLILDVTKGEGWAPLCEFLNVPVPLVEFPRTNSTEEFRKAIVKKERRLFYVTQVAPVLLVATLAGVAYYLHSNK